MCQTSVAESADFGMNTEIMHKVFGENSQEALISSKAELARLENRLSRFISGSEGPLIDHGIIKMHLKRRRKKEYSTFFL